jgi:hypothetical protein
MKFLKFAIGRKELASRKKIINIIGLFKHFWGAGSFK